MVSVQTRMPFPLNRTWLTALLSVAVAATVMLVLRGTVDPLVGKVMETVGLVVSGTGLGRLRPLQVLCAETLRQA